MRVNDRPIFIDIDGTLTDDPEKGNGRPNIDRIQCVKKMVSEGDQIVLGSGRGTEYVKLFANKHKIKNVVCIGKPDKAIDDNPIVRNFSVINPSEFFGC